MPRSVAFSPEDARALYAYNQAVFGRFVRRLRRLPWRQVSRKRGIGHESLFQTLVHILNVQEVWLAYIVRGRTSDAELQALFDDRRRKPSNWKEFDTYAKRVWDEVDATLRHATSRNLGRRVKVFWMPGRYTVRDAILQTTLEEAHHLGEVIAALWQDDTAPPDMTWLDLQRAAERKARRA